MENKGVGLKYDGEKPQLSLVSTKWLNEVGKVMTFGAKKYAPNNWRGGFAASRLVSAALRHLLAWNDGEDNDPETGLSHLAHASCCLMFLTEQMITKPGLDDRHKETSTLFVGGNVDVGSTND